MESPGRTRTGRVSFLLSPITPLYAFPGRIPSVSKSYLSGKTLLKVHKRFKFSHSSQPQFTQRNTESSGQQRIVKTGCKRVFSGDEFADEWFPGTQLRFPPNNRDTVCRWWLHNNDFGSAGEWALRKCRSITKDHWSVMICGIRRKALPACRTNAESFWMLWTFVWFYLKDQLFSSVLNSRSVQFGWDNNQCTLLYVTCLHSSIVQHLANCFDEHSSMDRELSRDIWSAEPLNKTFEDFQQSSCSKALIWSPYPEGSYKAHNLCVWKGACSSLRELTSTWNAARPGDLLLPGVQRTVYVHKVKFATYT